MAATDLTQFGLAEMLRCNLGIRRAARGAPTFEDAAARMMRFFYDTLCDAGTGNRQLVLARLYKSHPYAALEPEQRAFADRLLDGAPASPLLQCLCLVASLGEEEAWNDRHRSHDHLAIPLQSAQRIEEAPMISEMVRQFGVDPAQLVNPQREDIAGQTSRTYGVFHVEEAAGSPFVPAQEEFVRRYGVRSVIAFGGSLPTGSIFAAILFSRVPVTRVAADRFRGIALDARAMLFPFDDSTTFVRPSVVA